jgi:hypothetical protein
VSSVNQRKRSSVGDGRAFFEFPAKAAADLKHNIEVNN